MDYSITILFLLYLKLNLICSFTSNNTRYYSDHFCLEYEIYFNISPYNFFSFYKNFFYNCYQ